MERKEFTMRCSEEDFASVKPILDQYELDYSGVSINNDNAFVKFDGIKTLTSVNSRDACDMFISGAGDAIDIEFNYKKIISCISGLDWLQPQKQTLEDLREKKPYPPNMTDMFQKDPKSDPKTFEGFAAKFFGETDPIDPTHINPEFHISFFPKKESPISSGINISAGNVALAYMEFKKTHPEIEPFCIHDKSQL